MAARRNRRGRRRNRGRFGFLYKMLSALIIFAAILAGCVVFFRVNQVLVHGQSRYTESEIIAASGIEQGDNLFGLNKGQIYWRISTQLPYVDDVKIERKFPDTILLQVTESRPVAWLESGGAYWLLDSRCKILETGDRSLTEGLAELRGLSAVNPTVGSSLTVEPEEQEKLDRLRAFLAAIRERQMTGSLTGFLDLTSENEIRFGYGANLTVIMPINGDFAEKTYDLKRALETMDERGITRTGTLDMNYESREAHLLPTRWLPTTPADQVQTPTPSPTPEAGGETQGEDKANEANEAQ